MCQEHSKKQNHRKRTFCPSHTFFYKKCESIRCLANPFFLIYPNHSLYTAVPVIVLGSLNIANPAEKRRENEFLLYILTIIITAKAALTCLLGLLNIGVNLVKFLQTQRRRGEKPLQISLLSQLIGRCVYHRAGFVVGFTHIGLT